MLNIKPEGTRRSGRFKAPLGRQHCSSCGKNLSNKLEEGCVTKRCLEAEKCKSQDPASGLHVFLVVDHNPDIFVTQRVYQGQMTITFRFSDVVTRRACCEQNSQHIFLFNGLKCLRDLSPFQVAHGYLGVLFPQLTSFLHRSFHTLPFVLSNFFQPPSLLSAVNLTQLQNLPPFFLSRPLQRLFATCSI